MLQLFSTKAELLAYAVQHYRIRSSETSSLMYELYRRYQVEIQTMPDALEEFTRETIERLLKEVTVEQRLAGLTPEQRLKGLSAEERAAMLRLLQDQEKKRE